MRRHVFTPRVPRKRKAWPLLAGASYTGANSSGPGGQLICYPARDSVVVLWFITQVVTSCICCQLKPSISLARPPSYFMLAWELAGRQCARVIMAPVWSHTDPLINYVLSSRENTFLSTVWIQEAETCCWLAGLIYKCIWNIKINYITSRQDSLEHIYLNMCVYINNLSGIKSLIAKKSHINPLCQYNMVCMCLFSSVLQSHNQVIMLLSWQ